jgi:antitoxin CptB
VTDRSRVRKLRWRSRRGMKELDILLERFLDKQSKALADGRWPALEQLLEWEDDVFWDGIQNPARVSNDVHRSLLVEIRKLHVPAD